MPGLGRLQRGRHYRRVRTEVGVPDVVVNNAGIAIVGPLRALARLEAARSPLRHGPG